MVRPLTPLFSPSAPPHSEHQTSKQFLEKLDSQLSEVIKSQERIAHELEAQGQAMTGSQIPLRRVPRRAAPAKSSHHMDAPGLESGDHCPHPGGLCLVLLSSTSSSPKSWRRRRTGHSSVFRANLFGPERDPRVVARFAQGLRMQRFQPQAKALLLVHPSITHAISRSPTSRIPVKC